VRPVTVLQAGPCVVTQHKLAVKDGYEAAQIGLVEFVKESRLTKPARGHLAKNNLPPVKFMREVPLETDGAADGDVTVKVGDRVLVEIFEGERFVDIVGVSKGKGFQGVVKRHHFAGGPKSHGSMFQITGSIGSSAFPSRVFKGMRMSGHMGHARGRSATSGFLGVDKEENLLVVEGSVAWAAGRVHRDHQGEEAAQRAPGICGFGYGRSLEGGEASGEEGVVASTEYRVPSKTARTQWQRLIFTILGGDKVRYVRSRR